MDFPQNQILLYIFLRGADLYSQQYSNNIAKTKIQPLLEARNNDTLI